MNTYIRKGLAIGLIGVVSGMIPNAGAVTDVDREFEFASGLVDLGFADLANQVVQGVLRLHPDQRDRATRIQGEILVSQRRFKDAEELVASMPAGHAQRHALSLRVANGYFRIGDVENAKRLYDAFFETFKDRMPEDPDLLRFFQDAAYQYGQMLERMGDRAGAVRAYQRLLDAGMDDDGAERRLQMDVARLYLRLGRDASGTQRTEYLDKAIAVCEAVQWGGYDLWFGQSIGIMANVELARGNETGARDLLRRYMDDLNQLDDILKEQEVPASMSPVASARFLLGELYEKQVEQLRAAGAPESEVLPVVQRALTEYFNVFGKYGTSEWGADASIRGRALVSLLETEYGRRVNIDFGQHGGQAAQAQFTIADDFFRQRNYEQAIVEYLRILNAFPEGEPSVRGLSNLMLSYVHTDNPLYARMMAAYLSERFAGNDLAANAILMAGREYVTRQDEEKFSAFFDYYFAGFPGHERAPALLMDMARRREAAGDREGASVYYEQIVENYPRDRNFLRALFAMAMSEREVERYDAAIPHLERFLQATQPGAQRVRAQFLLADSLQRLGRYTDAVRAYGQIVRWMGAEEPPDNRRPEDAAANEGLAERSLFFVGVCFSRMREPAEQVEAFRGRAVSTYRQFLSRYPQSTLAPTAMRDKGAQLLALGRSAEAADVFQRLAEEYPDSEEGRSALFALVSSAFDIGEVQIAQDAFRRMIESPADYSPEEFTRIGQLMLDNGLYADVIPAYRRVVETTEERRMLELALFGLGYAYSRQGNPAESVEALSNLLERFPNSAYLFESKFLIADAEVQRENYHEAHAALADVLRLSQDNVMMQRAQFKLAGVQELSGDSQAALASYQRIALLQDPNNRDLRPIIEDSLIESIKLMMQLELYREVEEVCEQFMQDFARSERIEEVRRMRSDARRRAMMQGAGA